MEYRPFATILLFEDSIRVDSIRVDRKIDQGIVSYHGVGTCFSKSSFEDLEKAVRNSWSDEEEPITNKGLRAYMLVTEDGGFRIERRFWASDDIQAKGIARSAGGWAQRINWEYSMGKGS